ncbi:DNA/RNA non-specific endonuclease [Dokdonella sp. MW10]|uniref:DNA/RNA non-specific endonuclease n=1 Tax=Dokdonella sp. MW10 TaxID=2992926 RepID=UPI003F7DC3C0
MGLNLEGIAQRATQWLGDTADDLAQKGGELAGQAADAAGDALSAAGDGLQSARQWAGDRLDDLDGLRANVGNAIDGAVDTAEQAVDGFRADIVEVGERHGGVVGGALARQVSDSIGLVEGASLAVYDMGKGVVQLADGAVKLIDPVRWAVQPEQNLARAESVGQAAVAIGDLASPAAWLTRPEANLATAGALWDGVTEGYQQAAADGDWAKFAGRGVIDVGSMFIGVGEANAVVKGSQGAGALARVGEGAAALDRAGDAARALDAANDASRAADARLGRLDDLGPARATPLRTVTFDSIDELNAAANAAQPNTIYQFGELRWTTDPQARVVRAEGRVELDPVGRNDPGLQRQIGNEGRDTDVGFHLIADRFGGPTNRVNVVPGNGKPIGDGLPNLNNGAYKRFENQIAGLLENGHDVDMQVTLTYNPGNTTTRPDAFVASYRVDGGDWIDHSFINK